MTDGRESDVAVVLANLRDEPKICTSAAKAACFCGDYVVAEATTYKEFRVLTPTRKLLRLILHNPPLALRHSEIYSFYECEPA